MLRSIFLSLDGLDGTGKTTQCRLLAEWLRGQGREVTECTDPGGTAVGKVIRDLLLHHREEMSVSCEALLFMASRAQLTAEIIQPALGAGHIVIADRYVLANVVYQGHAGGLDPALLWQVSRVATGGLEPDLTLVLDLPVDVALSRRPEPADRMESRDTAYRTRVRNGFLAEAKRQPDRLRVIDASQSREVVHAAICREVARVLATGSRT
jgi:dTMP kinase